MTARKFVRLCELFQEMTPEEVAGIVKPEFLPTMQDVYTVADSMATELDANTPSHHRLHFRRLDVRDWAETFVAA